jgi:hypothetical protein
MKLFLFLILICSNLVADSFFLTKANVNLDDMIAFSLPTNEGRAHVVLKRISNDEWRGKVNRKYEVSGTSDDKTLYLFFKLNKRHFFAKIENGIAKIYSREKLNKKCSTSWARSGISGASTEKQLKVSLVVEKRAQEQIGDKPALWIRSVFNASKAHYRKLGLSLFLQEIILINRNFDSSNIDDLLEEFRQTRPEFGFAGSSDVVHLIFGSQMEPSDTIGLAYLGTVCQFKNYRFGVIRLVSRALQPVLFSHEVGHNLGANHTSAGIMRAILSSPSAEFSAESISEIQGYVSEFGECLKPKISPSLLKVSAVGSRIIVRFNTSSSCKLSILSMSSRQDQFVKGRELVLGSRRISGSGKAKFTIASSRGSSGLVQARINCGGSMYRSSTIKVSKQPISFES